MQRPTPTCVRIANHTIVIITKHICTIHCPQEFRRKVPCCRAVLWPEVCHLDLLGAHAVCHAGQAGRHCCVLGLRLSPLSGPLSADNHSSLSSISTNSLAIPRLLELAVPPERQSMKTTQSKDSDGHSPTRKQLQKSDRFKCLAAHFPPAAWRLLPCSTSATAGARAV